MKRIFLKSNLIHVIKNGRKVSTMKAWQVNSYGGTEKLQFEERVKVGTVASPKDVVVEVHAASVNPVDIAMLGGYGSATLNGVQNLSEVARNVTDIPDVLNKLCSVSKIAQNNFPIILGRDFSGKVIDTGQEAGKTYKPGDEVWGVVNPLFTNKGSHSEFTVATTSDISLKPKNLTHIEAASMPYVTLTAWSSLTVFGNFRESNAKNKRVLVLGGSGGIGTFVIQLLKEWGVAEITTTCATDALDQVLTLGANVALDYKTHNVLSELELIKGFDLILDCARTDQSQVAHYMKLLKSNYLSHYVSLNSPVLKNNDSFGFPFGFGKSLLDFAPTALNSAKEGKQYRWGFYMPNSGALRKVAKYVEEQKIQPVVDEVFPFNEVIAAFDKVSKGHNRGKNVINVKHQDRADL